MMLKNYLKIGVRRVLRQVGYSAINVIGLSIGIATCLLILLYVQDELRYDAYHEKADRIYRFVTSGRVGGAAINTAKTPAPLGPALQQEFPEVVDWVRVRTPDSRFAVQYGQQTFFEKGFFVVDSTMLDIFSYTFVHGDPETALDAPAAVVITDTAAKKYFGEANPIGEVIRADFTQDLTVTGVIEKPPRQSHMDFDFLVSMRTADIWMATTGNPMINPGFANWNQQSIYTYVELAEGADAEALQHKIPALIEKYIGDQPQQGISDLAFTLQPLRDIHLHSHLGWEIEANGNVSHLYIFSGVALIVLLIACINFMNLATARSIQRAKEIGVRKVAGAGRRQLVGQLLSESLVVTAIAAALAVLLLASLLKAFSTLTDKDFTMAHLAEPTLLWGLAGLTLGVGLLAGSYPALVLSGFKPVDMMRGTFKGGRGGIRKALVVVQFAISMVLLAGLGVVYNQMTFVQEKDLGFDREQVVAIPLSDPQLRGRGEQYRTVALEHPNVVEIANSRSLPGESMGMTSIRSLGQPEEASVTLEFLLVGYEFADVLDIDVVAGRNFVRTDTIRTVMLNESAVAALGLDDPVGQFLSFSQGTVRMHVVGVVQDFHFKSLHYQLAPSILLVIPPSRDWGFWHLAKIRGDDIRDTMAFMEQTWNEINPGYPFEFYFLNETYDQLYRAETKFSKVFGYFTIVALLIACLGLFGLAAFTTAQRTKEIGVRKVLGASVGSIIVLVAKDFVTLVGVAFVLATPLAYFAMRRWLDGFAYRIDLTWETFLIAGVVALTIALLTVSYQSIRASLANPVESLRYE